MAEKFEVVRDAILGVLDEIATIGDHPDRPSVAKFAATRVLAELTALEVPKAYEGSPAAELLAKLAEAIENVAGMMLPPVACQSLAVVALSVVLSGNYLVDNKEIRRIIETDLQDHSDNDESWIAYTERLDGGND